MSRPPSGLHPTPSLVVDVDRLDANIASMAALARHRGVALRPHAKTHKTVPIARRQLSRGAVGLSVATVAEAEVLAAAGIDDLFIAYPLWVTSGQAGRIARVLDCASLTIGLDSAEGARALAHHLRRADGLAVAVEVDSGQHRSGVAPEAAGEVAEAAAEVGLDVVGVFTFPGHSYAPGHRADVARQEAAALETAREVVKARGLACTTVSGGSTPTAEHLVRGVLTELRPGVYVFGDAQQWELGSASPEHLALTCHATVVSTAGGRVVLDAGSKVLGADRPAWTTGFGRLLDHPDARIGQLSEHHAVVEWGGGPRPSVGDRLRVVPNHCCSAVNLADRLLVERDGEIVDRWDVAARGANT